MASQELELEGTWEEVLAHSPELAGRRVRVTVLPEDEEPGAEVNGLPPENQRMLESLRKWQATPLTPEEIAILDEFEQFRKEHPFTLSRSRK
jgi:hypothetical protein